MGYDRKGFHIPAKPPIHIGGCIQLGSKKSVPKPKKVPTMNLNKIIALAKKARRSYGLKIRERSAFGDCGPVSRYLLRLIDDETNLAVKLAHGYFQNDPTDEESRVEHTWVLIADTYILDPTVDQFFSSLDVDLETACDGIYFDHPSWDGDWLKSRYKHEFD